MQQFGRYVVQRVIGKGAMGIVYQCKDPQIGREVAIKTVLLDSVTSGDEDEIKNRIFKEAQAAGVLSHPNIVTIFDVGEDDGTVYIVMEFLEGNPLDTILKNTGALQSRDVISIIDQVGGALDFAHRKGIVHRDVKPANIMQSDDGRSILMDFGIAWMFDQHSSERGTLIGSPIYMSPEQINGEELTGASDIYSLSAVIFELLTGKRPFPGKNFNEIVQAKYDNKRLPIADIDSSLPQSLEGFFDKAMAAKPERRFATGKQLASALKAAIYSQVSSQSFLTSTQSPFTHTVRQPLNEPQVEDRNQDDPGMAKTMRMDAGNQTGNALDQTRQIPFNPSLNRFQQEVRQQQQNQQEKQQEQRPPVPPPSRPNPYASAPPADQQPQQQPQEPVESRQNENQEKSNSASEEQENLSVPSMDELDSTLARREKEYSDEDVREEIARKASTLDFQRPEDLTVEGQRRLVSELKMLLPLLDAKSTDSEFLCRIGTLYLRLSKYNEAISFFKRAYKYDWECVDAYFAIAQIYSEYKMDDKAKDYWAIAEWMEERKVGKLSGKNSYRLGKKLEKISLIRGAITVWEEAGAMEPWHLDTWRDLSRYFLQMKDYRRAMTALQHMVKLSKYDALAYRNLAVCYQNTKNYQKALTTWEKALRLEPKGEGAQRARKQIKSLKSIIRRS